jgi:peptidoglycan hydrolase-like protein with peptidoglycan-binding domain
MPDPLLKLHDKGTGVIEAQGLLNRNGAILDPDGDFGKGTETAVREFQAAAGLPDSGTIDAATWQRLRALPEPSPDIPTRAVSFIAREEVGSRGFYDAQCARPTWPGGASGVTIGVGYDLGYQAGFAADWSDLGHHNTFMNMAMCDYIGDGRSITNGGKTNAANPGAEASARPSARIVRSIETRV